MLTHIKIDAREIDYDESVTGETTSNDGIFCNCRPGIDNDDSSEFCAMFRIGIKVRFVGSAPVTHGPTLTAEKNDCQHCWPVTTDGYLATA